MFTLKRPLRLDEPNVSVVVDSIVSAFPLPVVKPPFDWADGYFVNTSDILNLKDVYNRLPNVSPDDFDYWLQPDWLSVDLFLNYASTFLVSQVGKELGVDPVIGGLVYQEPRCFLSRRFLRKSNIMSGVDLENTLRREEIIKRFRTATVYQRRAMRSYIVLYNDYNRHCFSDWLAKLESTIQF